MTEWFDIDEPCMYGDTEDVLQNLAYVNTFTQSSAFRLCPKNMRMGLEFQTVHGQAVRSDMSHQMIRMDYEKERIVCLNKDQTTKPNPPNYWYHRKIKCMDYKMR